MSSLRFMRTSWLGVRLPGSFDRALFRTLFTMERTVSPSLACSLPRCGVPMNMTSLVESTTDAYLDFSLARTSAWWRYSCQRQQAPL